jgi:glycosyltransferase involved in cell wall biosynthesis
MKQPKQQTLFSVIIPTYNRGYVVWKALQSLQQQLYPYWEAIVVDDGSSDDTQKVITEFQQDPRITYVKQEQSGAARARNHGLELAKGEIITYLDSDDHFYSNCLSTAKEFFDKFPDVVFAIPNYNRRIELYDENYRLLDFTEMSSAQKVNISLQDIFHWKVKSAYGTGLFHKAEAIKNGVQWDENLHVFEDWDIALQLGTKYPDGFEHIPFALFEYVQKYGLDGRCSQTSYREWAKGFEAIYQKHKDEPLMKDQDWYPSRVKKYQELQKQVELGLMPESVYKYFPDFAPVIKRK